MYRVMIVDDEPIILEGLTSAILWDEYNLMLAGTALNGIDAWDTIKDGGIDVLITDIRMPKLDGIGLLKKIRQAGLPVKCIVLSGYSDFEYVKESVRLGIENYLIKPINLEECLSTLDGIVRKLDLEHRNRVIFQEGQATLRDNTIARWMLSSIDDRELAERGELLSLKLSGGFRAAVLHWLRQDLDTDAKTTQQFALFCKERIEQAGLGYALSQPFCRIFLLFHASEAKSSLRNTTAILNQVSREIYEKYHVSTMASIGDYQGSFRNVGISMRHAHDMIDYRYLIPGKTVFVYEDYLHNQEQFPRFMGEFLEQLQDLLTIRLSREEVLSHIETLIAKVSPESVLKITHLYSLCILTIMQIIQAVSSFQPNAAVRLDEQREHMADIYDLADFGEIMGWMKGKIKQIFDIAEDVHGNYSKLVLRILSYVDRNFYQDINLKTIAASFEISPFYLGQLFSSEVGEHFTEYLNKYRIAQAKRLLKQDISVKEVAQKVGYTNWNYFYTVFKKYAGMSPSELKRRS